jgi:hypothetical protein
MCFANKSVVILVLGFLVKFAIFFFDFFLVTSDHVFAVLLLALRPGHFLFLRPCPVHLIQQYQQTGLIKMEVQTQDKVLFENDIVYKISDCDHNELIHANFEFKKVQLFLNFQQYIP